MELTEKLANKLAKHIHILGTNVLLLTEADMNLLARELTLLGVKHKQAMPNEILVSEYHTYNTVLYWDLDQGTINSIPKCGPDLIYNILSNKSLDNICYDFVGSDDIIPYNINSNTPSTPEISELVKQEVQDIWPNIAEKYGDQLGYISGGTATPHGFTSVATMNHRDYVKSLVYKGAKKIIVSEIHEGAWTSFYRKAQLLADSCRDFIDPKNFILTTACTNAEISWQNYCKQHGISNSINIMECRIIEKSCHPTPKSKLALDKLNKKTHDKIFTSLNAGVLRVHRMMLGIEMIEQNILHKGLVSLGDYKKWMEFVSYGTPQAREKFEKQVPIWLDLENQNSDGIHDHVDSSQAHLYDSYFSIVAETQFFSRQPDWNYEDISIYGSVFRTEKTIKPMWFKQPFLVLGPPGYLKVLREHGYMTFSPMIDESYDSELNDERRLQMVVAEAKRLCDNTEDQWNSWKINMLPIVEHNYNWITHNHELSKDYEYMFEDLK